MRIWGIYYVVFFRYNTVKFLAKGKKMNTLLINAHPQFHTTSYTQKLQNYFVEQWNKLNAHNQMAIINLAEMDIPRLDDKTLTLFSQQMAGETLTAEQQERKHKMQEIL